MDLEVTYSVLDHDDGHVNLLDDEHIDRAGDISLIKRFKKHCKTIVIVVVIILIIVTVVGIAVHNSENEEKGNTSNNIASHANSASDSSNTSEGETYIVHTTYGRTNTNERETCVFHTPVKFLEELKTGNRDPLEDKCNISSKHFIDPCNKSGYSTQQCKPCGFSAIQLPDFCFCDKQIHCNNNYDRPRTITCPECWERFRNSPYKDRGNCACTSQMINCSCHEGFVNDTFMCSSIEKRLCERSIKSTNERLDNCIESNNETCVFTRSDCTEFICNIFSEGNRKLRENTGNLKNCR